VLWFNAFSHAMHAFFEGVPELELLATLAEFVLLYVLLLVLVYFVNDNKLVTLTV